VRIKYIFENQVYACVPTELLYAITKNFLFEFDGRRRIINDSHIICFDTTPLAVKKGDFETENDKIFGGNKLNFDVVVGNPPYQKESGTSARDDAIYNYFYDLAEKVADKYMLITPARFLFNAGSTSKKWNKKMLNDKHLKVVLYEQNSSRVFPNVGI